MIFVFSACRTTNLVGEYKFDSAVYENKTYTNETVKAFIDSYEAEKLTNPDAMVLVSLSVYYYLPLTIKNNGTYSFEYNGPESIFSPTLNDHGNWTQNNNSITLTSEAATLSTLNGTISGKTLSFTVDQITLNYKKVQLN